MAQKVEVIEVKPITTKTATITIEGQTDLILNKMNDPTAKALTDARKDKAKSIEKPDKWECIITSMHWLNGKPAVFTEESLKENLNPAVNAPCITAFGLKKSFGDATVRAEIAQYATKLNASVNVIGLGDGLIPVQFTTHNIDEKLMSPKKGAPVLVHLNRFSGWKATFQIEYIDNVYSLEQIINIVNLAGFGIGIGSGRSSGYGRYKVIDMK